MHSSFVFLHCFPKTIGHKTGRDGKDEDLQDANGCVNITTCQRERAFACKLSWIPNIAGDGPYESIPWILVFLRLFDMLYKIE